MTVLTSHGILAQATLCVFSMSVHFWVKVSVWFRNARRKSFILNPYHTCLYIYTFIYEIINFLNKYDNSRLFELTFESLITTSVGVFFPDFYFPFLRLFLFFGCVFRSICETEENGPQQSRSPALHSSPANLALNSIICFIIDREITKVADVADASNERGTFQRAFIYP